METNTKDPSMMDPSILDPSMMDFNTSWIDEFVSEDEAYKHFYQTQIGNVKLFLLYVDRSNTIIHIKKNLMDISNNMIHKKNLISLIRENMYYNHKAYRPISILQYSMNLAPKNVKNFLNNTNKYNFLTAKNSIDSIRWNNTIELFQDMNSLYIIFYEKWYTDHKGTRKIYIESKKKSKHRKTKKKQLKEKSKKI